MGDHHVRAQLLDGMRQETEAGRHGRNSRRVGCLDVENRIPHEGRASAPAAPDHLVHRRRGGLGVAWTHRIAADHRGEAVAEAQFRDKCDRQPLELVGHDGEPDALLAERIHRLDQARKGYGSARDVGFVEAQQLGEAGFDLPWLDFARSGKAAFEHMPWAAANHRPDSRYAQWRPPQAGERMVECRRQVGAGVEERAIEVEADDVEGKVRHGAPAASNAMALASQSWQGRSLKKRSGLEAGQGMFAKVSDRPIAAVILAAGKGTRMKSDTHKVLHPLAGRPMLLHLIDSVATLAPARTIVVVGAGRDQVEAAVAPHGAETAHQAEQLGTGHAVQQAETALAGFDGDVLILFGDVPLVTAATMRRMLDRLHGNDNPAVVVLGFRPTNPGAYGRVIANPDGSVVKIVEIKDATPEERAETLCNSGLMAARSRDLFALLARVTDDNAAGEYYLTDLPQLAGADGRPAAVIEVPAPEVSGVNSRGDLAHLEAEWQQARRAQAMADGVTLIAPETVWFAYDTRLGRDVTIEPNVVFGPGVEVGDQVTIHAFSHIEGATIATGASVGPYARLRPGTVLGEGARIGNFVETKKAVIGAGAKANHLTYLGDVSVGAGANIGAGTITCNYDGFLKYGTEIGAGAFVGSNSALVAPVSIGPGAIVGAGSVVTQDVEGDALALARAPQEAKPGWAKRFRAHMAARKESK